MSTNVTLNGQTFAIPAEGDSSWGTVLSNYFIAISTGVLQKTGGTFTLTAEADFGATYGLKSAYFKSRAANPSATGSVRLGNTETISWRNAGNSADLGLTVSAGNALQFNGSSLAVSGLLANADIAAAAAIALNKLAAVTASRAVVSDGSGFLVAATTTATEIGYVNGVTSAIQTQLDAKAPSASPTFTGTVTTPVTASRALVTGASSELAVSATTATELGYVNGVTSAIQTQLDGKVLKSTYAAKGDILAASGASTPVVVGGSPSNGDVLTWDTAQSASVKWATPTSAPSSSIEYSNGSITASVAANALTIALKTSSGSDASAGSPIKIGFRNSTLGTGTYNQRSVTAALSTVISSGSTAGFTSAVEGTIYVYAIDNSGTVELAWSGNLLDEGLRHSTTAEGGAGAADSGIVIYSTTARTNVPIRLIGRIRATQATAGTWATTPSEISNIPFDKIKEIDGTLSATTLSVSTTVYDTGSIVLPPGTWMVYAKIQASAPGTTHSILESSLSLSSATIDDLYAVRDTSTQITFQKRMALCPRVVTVASNTTTTVYLCVTCTFTGTAPATTVANMVLKAIRMGT